MITISGSGLDWHDIDSYFRPNAVGRYSFDQDNNVVFNDLKRLFDVALVMDFKPGPVASSAGAGSSTIMPGAMPQACVDMGPSRSSSCHGPYKDKPDMTAPLAEKFTIAGNRHDALVVPAGLAFARSIAERPGLDLYVDDKRHPSLAGT